MQPTRSLLAASHAVGEQILARPGTRIESLVGRGHLILSHQLPPTGRPHSKPTDTTLTSLSHRSNIERRTERVERG